MSHFSQGHALLIGVGADLPGTVADATGLTGLLTDEGRCAYPPAQVTTLTAKNATSARILTALDDLSARAGVEETVLIYFSGHGYRVDSPLGPLYFLMPYGYDSTNLTGTAIQGNEFRQKLAQIRARKLLVLLDCCHAGGMDETKLPGFTLAKAPLPADAVEQLIAGQGRAVIASSRADELSFAGKPYSAFTLALMEALCGGGVARQDGYVRLADLALHARETVPRRTRDRQHPILNFDGADNFVVAYYAGGDPQPKGLPFAVDRIEIEPQPGTFNQRGQTVWGPQTNIQGDVRGPVVTAHEVQIGDRHETHYHTHEAPPPPPFTLDLADMENRYLQGLAADCDAVPLAGDGTPDMAQKRQPRLSQIYVDLDTTAEPSFDQICTRLNLKEAERRTLELRLQRGMAHERSPRKAVALTASEIRQWVRQVAQQEEDNRQKEEKQLGVALDALASAAAPLSTYEIMRQHTQLVLLGDPGSGKSTLTRRIASALATVAQPNQTGQADTGSAALDAAFPRWLLPVRVVLSTWANHLSLDGEGTATDLIDECVRILAQTGKVDDDAMQKRFLARLSGDDPSVLLLLDGLDEVADRDKRKKMLASVRRFCRHYGNVPLIVTCRVRPYTEGEHYRLPLPDFEIGPLPQPAIRAFVERWHGELAWAGLYTDAAAASARQRLLTALDDPNRHELSEMAETPLLLTMMARVNYKRGLPNSRAQLYEEYVKQLLYEWERAKLDEQGKQTRLDLLLQEGGVSSTSLDRALNELAYRVHGQGGSRDTVDIARGDMRDALEAIHPGSEDEKAAWAVRLLRLIDDRSGLIYALEQDKIYRFSHRTFQEYLAARWLATGNFLAKFREKLDHEQWREAIFLALGYQIWVQSEYDNALTVFFNLMPQHPHTEADWRRVLLLGEAYVRLLGPQRAGEAEQEVVAQQVIRAIPEQLTAAMQNRDLPPRQRLNAGLLLADLHSLPADLDDFVPIAAKAELGYDFRIAKYPITNTQYRRFFDEDGYAEGKPWWTEEAVKDIESWSYNKEWRKGPRLWGDPRFDRDTQPVVGVSWYEAVAYCEWLTEKLRAADEIRRDEIVRLPTEKEWMRAALGPHLQSQTRGEQRDGYPWGPDFDPALTNTEESKLAQTTPVYMYPHGKSSEGVWDLAGNVWEWLQEPKARVKGGSWYSSADSATASARFHWLPNYWYNYNGFRCVVVPISRA